jgi:hypothetical protein
VTQWHHRISQAAQAFESRWTQLALRRLDPELAASLHEQRNLWVEAVVTGMRADIELHGAAMVRGYVAVTAALEAAGIPDDAYQIGQDPVTGLMVAIGDQKAAVGRICEVYGEDVILISPDEVATLFANVAALKQIADVKRQFPGAEMVAKP